MRPLDIVADENIPLAGTLFGSMGPVRLAPGRNISPEMVRHADMLLVRSVTRVDAALLDGSAVRFVGSATSGLDHIDLDYLRRRGIPFACAPGANADSVVEYVLAALLHLATIQGAALRGKTLGIAGCGRIGSRLARRAAALGMQALLCDPPLAEAGAAGAPCAYLPLDALIRRADILSLHVPLVREGPHPTWHMIGRDELAACRAGAWLVNTSRGAVIDNEALLEALRRSPQRPAAVALDVWEDEPAPSAALLERVDVATPHIAGYSQDGKAAGARMLRDAMLALPGLEAFAGESAADPAPGKAERLLAYAPDPCLPETDWLCHMVRGMYDIGRDDRRMRGCWPASEEEAARRFGMLRRAYPERRAFSMRRARRGHVPEGLREAVRDGLGVRLDP